MVSLHHDGSSAKISYKIVILWSVLLKTVGYFVRPDTTFLTYLNLLSTKYSIMGNWTYLVRILPKSWFQNLYFDVHVFCIPKLQKVLKLQHFVHYKH